MPDVPFVVIIPSALREAQLPLLDQAVGSLRSKVYPIQVLIVSHRSPSPVLRTRYRGVEFVKAQKDEGFGQMNNKAIEIALKTYHPTWILLLNDDAYLSPVFFSTMVSIQKKSSADCLAPLVYTATNKHEVDNFGVEYFRSGYAKNNHRIHGATTLASAGCLLLRAQAVRKMINAYGFFFSPIYHYYLEDVDLSLRLNMIGCSIEKHPELIAYHHGSTSSGGVKNSFSLFHTYRNTLWVIICCWPKRSVVRNLPNILLVQAWISLYGTYALGPFFLFRMWHETIRALPTLMQYRKRTLRAYAQSRDFNSLLSPYSFRTYHGKTVPAV